MKIVFLYEFPHETGRFMKLEHPSPHICQKMESLLCMDNDYITYSSKHEKLAE
jgi:hypothetical protein